MKTRLLSLFVLSLFGIQASFAQSKITGQVLDESSEPLIGASVKVKGTTIGMPTDINGNFQLDVAPGSTWRYRISAMPHAKLRHRLLAK